MAPFPLAVAIATRNRYPTLRATLERLQALPEAPRLVVVDNGSTDGTAEQVRAQFPDVTVLAIGENRGAEARNLGVRLARRPLVAFADDDSWWAPWALSRAVAQFQSHRRLGLLAARVLVGPDQRLDPVSDQMAHSPLGTEPGSPGPSVLGFVACGVVVRTRAFLEVGGFPSGFGIGGEEELLALDLASAGWQLCYDDAMVAHHHPATSARDPARRRQIQLRNALWSAWLRRRPVSALRQTVALVRPALRDPGSRAGVLAALAGAPRIWRQRRPVPVALDRALRRLDGEAKHQNALDRNNHRHRHWSALAAPDTVK